MKKIVLLGASNSCMPFRLNSGLSSVEGVELVNLSMGATGSLSKMRAIFHEEEVKHLQSADLIILETNICDFGIVYHTKWHTRQYFINLIQGLYEELYKLNTKILVLLLPNSNVKNNEISLEIDIANIHSFFCDKYGFNYINVLKYYLENDINYFFTLCTKDNNHQLKSIMFDLGLNIAKNLDKFLYPKKLTLKKQDIKYKLLSPKDMKLAKGELKEKKIIASKQKAYILDKDRAFKLPKEYSGHKILGFTSYNFDKKLDFSRWWLSSSLIFKNKDKEFIVSSNAYFYFQPFKDSFIIDDETYVYFNEDNKSLNQGNFHEKNFIDYFALVDILLVKGEFKADEIAFNENFIKTSKEYDFLHLYPNAVFYKELIEDFLNNVFSNANIESLKRIVNEQKAHLENELSNLKNENTSLKESLNSPEQKEKILNIRFLEEKVKRKELKNKILEKDLGFTHEDILQSKILNQKVKDLEKLLSSIQRPQATIYTSAKLRIHSHLAYKLGQALIENSKSIKGYIRLPYVLSYIKEKYKAEQKAYNDKISKNPSLKLPPLASYPDYEAALKEKECLTYKLGLALMKANKSWYKGGYIKFYFESKRLKKEFKERQSKK
ncbi:hypothetical protein [Campylobacter avium]|uniref:hypothetical protein n=1 Tax=Campylobacter avium TaxID=522485 RepID=UPI0023573FB4|nr:hypothetical protein [Campylobacter avium]